MNVAARVLRDLAFCSGGFALGVAASISELVSIRHRESYIIALFLFVILLTIHWWVSRRKVSA